MIFELAGAAIAYLSEGTGGANQIDNFLKAAGMPTGEPAGTTQYSGSAMSSPALRNPRR